jgi:hypothetical protein
VKIGDKVYPGIATHVTGTDLEAVRGPIGEISRAK